MTSAAQKQSVDGAVLSFCLLELGSRLPDAKPLEPCGHHSLLKVQLQQFLSYALLPPAAITPSTASQITCAGGFGTVQWVTPAEYAKERPDSVVADRPHATLQAWPGPLSAVAEKQPRAAAIVWQCVLMQAMPVGHSSPAAAKWS